VLGIETSCDDTGVGLVDQDGNILSNCIHSQLKQHLLNGGIIPIIAKEQHLLNIDQVAKEAFSASGLGSVAHDVHAIAVTNRPGLALSLEIGLNYAKSLAKKYSKPLIPIHHMHAHALTPLLQNRCIKFPFIALLISGGHAILSIAKRYNNFHVLGASRDDAPGDILDKFARRTRLKNLGPPFDALSGGAAVELLSKRNGSDRFKHFATQGSIPMIDVLSCDFSFSGYKTSIDKLAPIVDDLWAAGNRETLLDELSHICASLQRAILSQLVRKLYRANLFYRMHWRHKNVDAYGSEEATHHLGFELRDIKDGSVDIVVSGGVAANNYIFDSIQAICTSIIDKNMQVYRPSKSLCSDNGLMIAWNGMLRYRDFVERNSIDYSDTDSIDSSIIYNSNVIDSVKEHGESPMGIDLSDQVRDARFSAHRLRHPELRRT